MSTDRDLLPLREIVVPRAQKPNLVENAQEALADPLRTLEDYLFTSGIRGHFERIFRDVKDGRGGGYWVQAEYGGGKTHFLSTLLCLLGESTGADEADIWARVGDRDLRSDWEDVIRPRTLLGAHMSLMGTASALGAEQPRLVDLIDQAIIKALARHGRDDPGISVGAEVLEWLRDCDSGVRGAIESAFRNDTGMSVEQHVDEYGSPVQTANTILTTAASLGIRPVLDVQVQDHFSRILRQLGSLGFDGLVLVIDEYFSRQGVLSEAQALEDGTVLETVGYKLGRQSSLPIYLVVASQSEMPAKLAERMDPLVLLRDEDKEYRQIVCKRIMDYHDTAREQCVLYHQHYSAHFLFLRRTSIEETREVFPFQGAVFRFLRNLVGSSRVNLPSTRFAIGVAYDAIAEPAALNAQRFLTRSDLMVGDLERQLLNAADMKDAGTALRQARDFVDNAEWPVASFHELAHRLLRHLFLDSIIGDQGQTVDQIVEGTLIEDPSGMLQPKQIVQTILQHMKACPQVESKGDLWRFAWRVAEGEQFESIFQRTRKDISKTDPRIDAKWTELLTANVGATAGVPAFLSPVISSMTVPVDYCGIQYPARAVYAHTNLVTRLQPLERLTHGERARVVVVPSAVPDSPAITDPAIAVVAPGALPDSTVNDIRGLLACDDIVEEYRIRTELSAERIVSAAEQKARELTRTIVSRQREVYREGEIHTKEGLALNPKQLFRESLTAGVSAIAGQLMRSAYPDAQRLLNPGRARRGAVATADSSKLFDAIFGGITEAKTKGAAEAYGGVLGLTTQQDPLRLVPNAGPGPDEVAAVIHQKPDCGLADLYDHFCNEPYGLPTEIVDLLVLACVALGKPFPLELRPPVGVVSQTRDRKGFTGPIRASQLRQLVWPRSLRGYTLTRSKEATWNDFVGTAQAIDPDRFSMSTDQRDIERQETELRERLAAMAKQIEDIQSAIGVLADASGDLTDPQVDETMGRLSGLAELHSDFSRQSALAYVRDTWAEADPAAIAADIQKLNSLAQLAGQAPMLSGRLSWFRALCAAAPEAMQAEIEMSRPLVTLAQLTAGPGQVATAIQQLNETWARFMARFREEHARYTEWVSTQREALAHAEARLPTLARLNSLAQLGAPDLPTAEQDLQRASAALVVCERPDDLDVGNGLSCLSCRYMLGQGSSMRPVGEEAEQAIAGAIDRRGRSLGQGLIAEAIAAAGDKDLLAVLAAAQAGEFRKIVDDDMLSDELVRRLGGVLSKAKQQTVVSEGIHEYLAQHPHVTRENLDGWLQQLREVLEARLKEAKQDHSGKQITLLLRRGDD